MTIQGRHQIFSGSRWTISVAICLIVLTILLICGTIVLALIPVYLTTKDVGRHRSPNELSFYTVYASNLADGRSRKVSDINGLSTQMTQDIPRWNTMMKVQSARFLAATESTQTSKATSSSGITCDQATELYGDLFTTYNTVRLPSVCYSVACRERSLEKSQNALRSAHRRRTTDMRFTDNTTQSIQMAFCAFSVTDPYDRVSSPTDSSGCTPETSKYIYLLDQDSNFFRFHPSTSAITLVGTLNCSTNAYPYSMAVQRNGRAWTLFTDGNLYTFDVTTAHCQTTSYVPEQEGLILFGMNFASDRLTNSETLYLSSDSSNPPYRLATLDIDTLEISVVGYYRGISARAELTGTSDGRLFGLFEGTPYMIAEINSTSGELVSQTAQDTIRYTSDSSNFAFASYSSNFFLFVGDQSFSDVFLFNSTTGTTTKQTQISNGIVGSAVSTCI